MVFMATRRVLIIDDEMGVQEVVRGCLEDIAGWEVITANSGLEGLSKVTMEQPNAIILDVRMPEMDGLTVLQQLKSNPKTCTIPVVLLTSEASLTQSDEPLALDIVGIIAKPFNPIALVDQVASLLRWSLADGSQEFL